MNFYFFLNLKKKIKPCLKIVILKERSSDFMFGERFYICYSQLFIQNHFPIFILAYTLFTTLPPKWGINQILNGFTIDG
mgnify:CR=1 FL=1